MSSLDLPGLDAIRAMRRERRGPSIGDRMVVEGARQLSLPGKYVRGGFAGHPTEPATGVEVLQRHGLVGTHDPLGVVKGLGGLVEAATDPLTYLGGVGQEMKLLNPLRKMAGLGGGLAESNPLTSALRGAMEDRVGYLRFPIPDVPPALARQMDALGPQYPGGAAKLTGLAAEVKGSPVEALSGGYRLKNMASSPHAESLAGEIPEGSTYLNAGGEGVVVAGPNGEIIRIGDMPGNLNRARIPEVLQPYRSTVIGPYKVEHLPRVSPLPSQEIGGTVADELAGSVRARGLDPSDLDAKRYFNASLTAEGKGLTHDPGAVRPGAKGTSGTGIFAPYPSYQSTPAGATRALAHGGPELVRKSLAQGLAHGTIGQGVDLPGLDALVKAHPQILDPEASRVMGDIPTPPPFSGDPATIFDNFSDAFRR